MSFASSLGARRNARWCDTAITVPGYDRGAVTA